MGSLPTHPPFSFRYDSFMPPAAVVTRLLLTALACGMPACARAEIRFGGLPPLSLSGDASAGLEYDSNVSVEEVDRSSNESDYALTLEAGIDARQPLSERSTVQLSYDFSANIYQTFSEVDRQTHIVGSGINWKFDAVDTDLSLYYINSRLDGEEFLELYRVSPAVSGFLSKRWFSRLAYVYQDKAVAERPLRDAITDSWEIDLYFFVRGLRSYLNLGYRYKDEDAQAAQLDYRSDSFKLRYVQRIEALSKLMKLELSWRYEDRDYRFDTPSIGEKRADDRHRLGIDVEVPLTSRSALQFYYGHGDYDSNLQRVDYTQNIAGGRFIYRW